MVAHTLNLPAIAARTHAYIRGNTVAAAAARDETNYFIIDSTPVLISAVAEVVFLSWRASCSYAVVDLLSSHVLSSERASGRDQWPYDN